MTTKTAKRIRTKAAIEPKRAPLVEKKKSRRNSYDRFKEHNGQTYTGMAIGRSHKWNYDAGVWRETKITPDLWELSYDVVKRRAGHAPEGSGAAVGTGYHWFILAHQYVEKLNADDYTTSMTGMKFKLAHKRATKGSWSASDAAQRKSLVSLLKKFIAELEKEPESTSPVPLHFDYRGKKYDGVGIPMMSSCHNGVCDRLDVTLNQKHIGVIRCTKDGWRLANTPQGLVNAIGEKLYEWYE